MRAREIRIGLDLELRRQKRTEDVLYNKRNKTMRLRSAILLQRSANFVMKSNGLVITARD